MMKNSVRLVLAFALAGVMSASQASAQTNDDNRTILTFSQPVAVPGRILLAGTYTFELDHSQMNRHLVRIYEGQSSRLLTTAFSIPDYRAVAASNTVITFREVAAGAPEQIHSWFYPGHTVGDEFVYGKTRPQAVVPSDVMSPAPMDQTGNEVAPTEPVKSAEVPAEMPKAEEPVAVDQTPQQTTPPPTMTTPPATTEEPRTDLPHTASELPAIALLGVSLLAIGFSVRRFMVRGANR